MMSKLQAKKYAKKKRANDELSASNLFEKKNSLSYRLINQIYQKKM